MRPRISIIRSVHPSVCLSIRLSVRLTVRPSVCLSITLLSKTMEINKQISAGGWYTKLTRYIIASMRWSIHPSVCQSINLQSICRPRSKLTHSVKSGSLFRFLPLLSLVLLCFPLHAAFFYTKRTRDRRKSTFSLRSLILEERQRGFRLKIIR